jgi:chorismate lyase/3-hydroxybenzoate synthase
LKVRAASQTQDWSANVTVLRPHQPPAWVPRLIEEAAGDLHLCSTTVPAVTSLSTEALAEAVADTYRRLARELTSEGRYPLRIWNFVPGIQAPMSGGDRYMAFNLGRFSAYAEWFRETNTFSSALPTASGVGVGGDTLWIHVLSATPPGTAVENPRQIPAYRYSRRYGLRPPCFARATKFRGWLFIGGTASIVGEDTRHADDLATQTRETFLNLDALIRAATTCATAPLTRLVDLRVHVARACDAPLVASVVDEFIPRPCPIEFVEAQLCRPELLVEIEGRATAS